LAHVRLSIIDLPDECYIRNGWQAGTTIPRRVRWRADKVGYAVPRDLWLRNALCDWGRARPMDDLCEIPPRGAGRAVERASKRVGKPLLGALALDRSCGVAQHLSSGLVED
jgi:hypothetical protein